MSDGDWLIAQLAAFGAVAGSVHRVQGDQLVLAAAHRLPPAVIERTRSIPKGKGMAGLAWTREVPVQTCDLKRDNTGDVQPGAKAVDAGAAVAAPVFGPQGAVRAVVGWAFAQGVVLADEQIAALSAAAQRLPA